VVRVAIEGGGFDSASDALVSGNQLAALYYNSLTGELGGYGAMAGDDSTSEEFASTYDEAAQGAVDALDGIVDAFTGLAERTATSVHNHRSANGASVYGQPQVYDGSGSLGEDPVDVAAYSVPSSLGGQDEDTPDFWDEIVAHLEGFAWPNADVDRLRQAATTWSDAAADVGRLSDYCDSATTHLEGQQSPEVPLARSAIADLGTQCDELADVYTALSEACSGYADQVEEHREIIKGIVQDMAIEAGISIVAGAVVGFFSFGAGAAGGAAIAGWRIASAARKILAALRALKAAQKANAVRKLETALDKAKEVLEKIRRFFGRGRRRDPDGPTPPRKPTTPSGTDAPPRVRGPNGEDLPAVPDGATPVRPADGDGYIYDVRGTEGLDPRVVEVRVMDPVTSGKYQYPNGYVSYLNEAGQAVNPLTGQTIAKKNPYWHIPLPPP